MPATDQSADLLVATLLERLAGAKDFAEACSIVLDGVAEECDVTRAVAAVQASGRVYGVGVGVSDDRLRALFHEAETADSPLGVALFGCADDTLLDPGPLLGLSFASAALLPFPAGRQELQGVVLLEAGALDDRTRRVSEVFRRCGPTLGRTLELELLRVQVERLGTQRNLLSDIVDTLPDPVLLTTEGNDIRLANRRADQLLSSTAHDSEGRRRAIEINNLLFSSFLTQAVIGAGRAESRELNLVDPSDGSDLLFEVISSPLSEPAGGGSTVISILRDITDLRRAVTELEAEFTRSRVAEHDARRERDQLNVVLENVGDPILVTDDKSNIVLMNRQADRLFLVPPGAGPGDPESRLVRANDTLFTTLISDFLLQPDMSRVEKVELTDTGTGRRFPAEILSSKIVNRRGEPLVIVSVVHDLSETVENERLAKELQLLNEELEERVRLATEELEERNLRLEWQSRELERASRLKSEFLASMSHELRTPINVMIGYTSLMRERLYGELTQQQDQALVKIDSTSKHLLALINDILDLSKIEAGQMPLNVEPVQLEDFVREVSEAIAPMVRPDALRYTVSCAPGLPVLRTDRTKLRQILLNLLSNAIKFTDRGEVSLEVRAGDEGRIRVVVSDTGVGIKAEDLDTIFEDFRQVDQSHTRQHGGTGLGLSITRKLVRLLGGSIAVTSTYGEGSRFTVELPVEWTAGAGAQPAAASGADSRA